MLVSSHSIHIKTARVSALCIGYIRTHVRILWFIKEVFNSNMSTSVGWTELLSDVYVLLGKRLL